MPSRPSPTPPAWLVALAFLTIYITWGTTYLAIRVAVHDEHLPPALFGGLRIGSAGFLVLMAQLLRGKSLRVTPGQAWELFRRSVFLFLLANWLVSVAEREVPSGLAAILAATMPLWMALLGLVWGDERMGWRGWFGIFVGFVGVAVLLAPRLQNDSTDATPWGMVLVLASAATWAVGSLMVRHRRIDVDHFTAAGIMMAFGGVGQIVVGLSLGEWALLPDELTWRGIGAYLYLLFVGSLAGFLAFNWLLGHVGAAQVGTYAYVNPIVAVVVAAYWNEPITISMGIGIVTILASVALIRNDHPPAPPIEPPE